MKKSTLKSIIVSTLFVAVAVVIFNTAFTYPGGVSGKNGSPSESTCVSCHNDFAINTGGGSVAITSSNMPGWTYLNSTSYNIDVTVSKTGATLFGFSMEALQSSGANAGTLVVTNAAETQTKNSTIGGNSRTSMVHKTDAGLANDTKTFSFQWTSPATNVGNVDFYAVGAACNNNGDEFGDYVYSTTQQVTPNTTGIVEMQNTLSFNIYPNPVKEFLNVYFTTNEKQNVKIEVYDLSGRFMENLLTEQLTAGIYNYSFDLKNSLASGTYLVKMEQGNNVGYKKIFVNN